MLCIIRQNLISTIIQHSDEDLIVPLTKLCVCDEFVTHVLEGNLLKNVCFVCSVFKKRFMLYEFSHCVLLCKFRLEKVCVCGYEFT